MKTTPDGPADVTGYPGGHAAFLAVAIATHAAVGYTLGALLGAPTPGVVAGVAPDVDLLVPPSWPEVVVHRGLTHSALAWVAVVSVLAVARRGGATGPDRATVRAAAAAYGSHLLLDATTPTGVPVASPLSGAYVELPLDAHDPLETVALWAGCGCLLWLHRRRVE